MYAILYRADEYTVSNFSHWKLLCTTKNLSTARVKKRLEELRKTKRPEHIKIMKEIEV